MEVPKSIIYIFWRENSVLFFTNESENSVLLFTNDSEKFRSDFQ